MRETKIRGSETKQSNMKQNSFSPVENQSCNVETHWEKLNVMFYGLCRDNKWGRIFIEREQQNQSRSIKTQL